MEVATFGGIRRRNRAAWRTLVAAFLAMAGAALAPLPAGAYPLRGSPSTTTSRSSARPGPK